MKGGLLNIYVDILVVLVLNFVMTRQWPEHGDVTGLHKLSYDFANDFATVMTCAILMHPIPATDAIYLCRTVVKFPVVPFHRRISATPQMPRGFLNPDHVNTG